MPGHRLACPPSREVQIRIVHFRPRLTSRAERFMLRDVIYYLMAKNLVIVESPAKAKTIGRFLGKDFVVKASMGHVRDLPKSKMGIDVEHNFEPQYGVLPEKRKVLKELKEQLEPDTTVWIATDEDREGEAIGWHLVEALKLRKDFPIKRIVFHEITESALNNALKNPRQIDAALVDAQQARRVIDRLVGYELSPLLWRKVRRGLSAGRVQSVAVRLIVEREREIRAFVPEEYWSIEGLFDAKGGTFKAALAKLDDKKILLPKEDATKQALAALENAKYTLGEVEKKTVHRSPAAPFITSTLQQESARKLGMSVKKTMMIAQQLYEGVDVGDRGTIGLISYMRTDSVNLAAEALTKIQSVITQQFGAKFALTEPRHYKGKKGAQEAHEAIRPVDASITPDSVVGHLSKDQYRLYDLIWKRTLACQMQEAILDQVGADITATGNDGHLYAFRATGQTIQFPGFMQVYIEGVDHEEDEEKESRLPPLEQGENVTLHEPLSPLQHFTKPPPRYTEASLVKKLEAEGIGRPSTYAPTISTVITRGYVEKEQKQLKPTEIAEIVNDVLVKHFPQIVDLKFTAEMEESLDAIAEAQKKWVPVIKAFYDPFTSLVKEKQETLTKADVVTEKTDAVCDKCGAPMMIKLGRFGKFLSCTKYPECKNAQPLKGDKAVELTPEQQAAQDAMAAKYKDKVCSKCSKPMVVKRGRFGQFLGCSGYPDCKNLENIEVKSGVKCPQCKEGDLIERHARKSGKVFYGCNKFPKCKMASWDKPLPDSCPKCSGLMVEKKGEPTCTVC